MSSGRAEPAENIAPLRSQDHGSSDTDTDSSWLTNLLACPRDGKDLAFGNARLVCRDGHAYPVVEGIPVMLLAEEPPTHWVMERSLELAAAPQQIHSIESAEFTGGPVDWLVQQAVGATCGHLYGSLGQRLCEYPIPESRLEPGSGKLLLDVGCSWGRWCIAAARRGYRPIGLDPCLLSVRAATRVARQLGVSARFVVGDVRHLPFKTQTFDVVFSYSVLQHLAKPDVFKGLRHAARVLRANGQCVIQLANMLGVRSLYWQMRRLFREPRLFEVRYWTPREMLTACEEAIGPARLEVDGYFGLGVQPADAHMLPVAFQWVVGASEFLRRAARRVPALSRLADSLYVISRRP